MKDGNVKYFWRRLGLSPRRRIVSHSEERSEVTAGHMAAHGERPTLRGRQPPPPPAPERRCESG